MVPGRGARGRRPSHDMRRVHDVVCGSPLTGLRAPLRAGRMHVVHQVRDSRAVAFSWRRHKARPEIHWKAQEMDRQSVIRSSLEWSVHNFLVSTRQSTLASYSLVRYEDLVARPEVELERIGRAIGQTWDLGSLLGGHELSFRPSHTASGNPSRFSVGRITIRGDDEWMEKMPRSQRLLSTALTAPGLVRYEYPLRL
jgi:hypothetical protein